MTTMDKLQKAMLRIGVPVYKRVAQFYGKKPPDDYIVIVSVDVRANTYEGDTDANYTEQLRASWYSRNDIGGRGAAMRKAGRGAGATVLPSVEGYDPSTRQHVVHQEFWMESEDD